MSTFRILNKKEQKEFRGNATKSFKFNPNIVVPENWHPVYRDECFKMMKKAIDEASKTNKEAMNIVISNE